MLVVVGVYLVVYLRGRPSTNMTAQLMGGAIILMGIVLTIYAVYKYIKRTRS